MAAVAVAGFPLARRDHTVSAGSSGGNLFIHRGGIFLTTTIIDTVPCTYVVCNPLGDTRLGTSMTLYSIAEFDQK